MIKAKFRSFNSKLLLFGEYMVILGKEALAMPIKNYSGKLALSDKPSLDNIAPFIQYLGALPNIDLNQELIESTDLENLIFESNIPIGYGAGSSGALTAAVYEAFVLNQKSDLKELKEDLASMEDFFHGSSSGLDPLIAFSDKNILTKEGNFHVIEQSANLRASLSHFYLVDTQKSRKTGPLVEVFKQKLEQPEFKKECVEQLSIDNSKAIAATVDEDSQSLESALSSISSLQFQYFQEMIPQKFKSMWKESLGTENVSFKLCGAGGGGFLLLYLKNKVDGLQWAKEKGIELIEIAI